jgi:hypothetical protein
MRCQRAEQALPLHENRKGPFGQQAHLIFLAAIFFTVIPAKAGIQNNFPVTPAISARHSREGGNPERPRGVENCNNNSGQSHFFYKKIDICPILSGMVVAW